jgi:hypothetical protein
VLATIPQRVLAVRNRGFVAPNGETVEVTTGAGGYYILQPHSTAIFSPAFPEVHEGRTVTPYVRLYPYYKSDVVYATPTTVPTCPGSPSTTAPPPTETSPTTVPPTTMPPLTTASPTSVSTTSTTSSPTTTTMIG